MFRWSRSFVTLLAVPAILLARTAFVPGFSQSSRDTSRSTWTVARTAAGHPDFQGVWTNYDPTPFERLNADERRPQGPAVSTADWLVQDSPVSPRRPSMVVGPPDGKVPLRREAVEKREHDAALPEDSLEHYEPREGCVTRGGPGASCSGGDRC